jgi:hypothetical protein
MTTFLIGRLGRVLLRDRRRGSVACGVGGRYGPAPFGRYRDKDNEAERGTPHLHETVISLGDTRFLIVFSACSKPLHGYEPSGYKGSVSSLTSI